MSNNKLTIIDADSLLYQSSKETLEESISILDEKIYNILNRTEANYYKLFLSDGPYFRHKIDPNYKSNRGKSGLLWLKTLKAYLKENWNAMSIKEIEADDICSIILNDSPKFGFARHDITLASTDKDLLQANHGKHFKYNYISKEGLSTVKGTWIETSSDDAKRFTWYQMLIGDAADTIKGVSGCGPVKTNELLHEIPTDNLAAEVLRIYLEHFKEYQGIEMYYKNYRLLKMLKTTEEYKEIFGKDLPEITFNEYNHD